jgi:hypothetical protein
MKWLEQFLGLKLHQLLRRADEESQPQAGEEELSQRWVEEVE